METESLFHGEHLPARIQYGRLFEMLPSIGHRHRFGRPGIDPDAMLRALVYRCLRGLPTLSDLCCAMAENPSLCEAVGMDPFLAPPGIERFSSWLRSTPNQTLQSVRLALVRDLVGRGHLRGKIVAFDSTAVYSPVRENNLKTTVGDRFNKLRFPKTDPEARLGVCRHYMASATQKVRFFWGYRNHALVDFETELPLWEQTHPANHHETRCAIPLLEAASCQLRLSPEVVCGDSGYDSEKILAHIIETLRARPVIAPNDRHRPNPGFRLLGKAVLCPAGLPMKRRGLMTPKRTGITYTQFSCPLHHDLSMRQKYLLCPADHPKFLSQKGCNYLLRHTASYRSTIPYASAEFAELYKKRTCAERAFARLLCLSMQTPTVRGLDATRNHCTIAHIAVLLVATAACRTGHPDKLAFVRTFVPNFMARPNP